MKKAQGCPFAFWRKGDENLASILRIFCDFHVSLSQKSLDQTRNGRTAYFERLDDHAMRDRAIRGP